MNRINELKEKYNRNEEIVREIVKGELSSPEIAKKYNVRVSTVYQYRDRKIFYGVQRDIFLEVALLEKIQTGFEDGMSISELSAKYNLEFETVRLKVKQLGLTQFNSNRHEIRIKKRKEIISLFKEGKTANEISEELDITVQIVFKVTKGLRDKQLKANDRLETEILKLHKEGKGIERIVRTLNTSHSFTEEVLRKNNQIENKINTPDYTERNNRVIELHERGLEREEIAKIVGISPKTTYNILKAHGYTPR